MPSLTALSMIRSNSISKAILCVNLPVKLTLKKRSLNYPSSFLFFCGNFVFIFSLRSSDLSSATAEVYAITLPRFCANQVPKLGEYASSKNLSMMGIYSRFQIKEAQRSASRNQPIISSRETLARALEIALSKSS
jgi:hypothetical protein